MGGSPSPVAPDLLSWARVLEDASCQPEELLHSCCSLLLLVFLCGSSYTSQMGTDALSTGDVTLVCFLLRWPAYVWEAFLFYFLFLWAGQEVWMNLKLSQSVPCPQLSILLFNECIFCPYHYLLTHLFSLKSLNAIRRWTLFSLPLQMPWSQRKKQALNKCLLDLPIRLLKRVLPPVWVYAGLWYICLEKLSLISPLIV